MARSDAYPTTVQTPVKKYLEWSSNEKCFTYWDKEAKQDKKLALPAKFIHYDELATIKGWDKDSNSAIYANEVKNTKVEPFVVRAFKGKFPLAEGLYQEIKEKISASAGFNLSLYAELNGEIVNLSFKASALMEWSKFAKDSRKSFLTNYFIVTGFKEEKNGAVKYNVPTFALGDAIEESVSKASDANYDSLMDYFKARKANSNQQVQVEELNAEEVPSNIPKFGDAPDIPSFETDELPF